MARKSEPVFVINELGPQIPEWIQLVPPGEVHGRTDFACDQTGAERAIAAFNKHSVDLVIDYEHQTMGGEFAAPDGKAPAAAWVKEMRFDPRLGLLGRTEWTHKAKTAVAAREYRYLSPVVIIDPATRQIRRLHSAGLTNKPAIVGMRPIVNAESLLQENEMEELCALLGLAPEASIEEIVAKVKALKEGQSASVNREPLLVIVAEETGVKLDGDSTTVANSLRSAFNRLKNPVGKVDAAELTKLQTEVAGLRKTLGDRECDELIAANSNKLPPAQVDWFKQTFTKDPEFARQWIAGAPELVANKHPVTQATQGDRSAVINMARKEWVDNAGLQAICSERAAVDDALREKKLHALTEDEVKTLALTE